MGLAKTFTRHTCPNVATTSTNSGPQHELHDGRSLLIVADLNLILHIVVEAKGIQLQGAKVELKQLLIERLQVCSLELDPLGHESVLKTA